MENALLLYPNPINNSVHINWDTNEKLKPTSLEIYTTDGKHILQQAIDPVSGNISIKTNKFSPGLYIVKFLGDGFSVQKKIIKQ